MIVFVVLAAVAVVVVVVGTAASRLRQRKSEAANQVVPGMPTRAPGSWTTATTPEAVLHRRLRDAVGGLRAVPGFTDARAALAVQAVTVDDALVAASALPGRVRDKPLAEGEAAVEAIERAVAALAAGPADDARSDLDAALADVTARVEALRAAGTGDP
ncbi:MAG: hypothetical protein ACLGI2_08265 [Acidimicrobiia bacterium]